MNDSNKELVRDLLVRKEEKDENNKPPSNDVPQPTRELSNNTKKRNIQVTLLHSTQHTQILYKAMQYIHQDRDLLLAELLEYCGFGANVCPSFFSLVKPKRASRKHLEQFHEDYYLDALEFTEEEDVYDKPVPDVALLESLGLVDCCPIPTTPQGRAALWQYCTSVAGATLHAASLLKNGDSNICIHWGGGRHHAHSNHASGFCYINDVVLGIQSFGTKLRVLYLDIDVHHADGVQQAFYETDMVMTVSFHRHCPGFFPATSGVSNERGRHATRGVGYNLNVIMPKSCTDGDFISMYQYTLENLLNVYRPQVVVLCVGADGVRGDPVVGNEGWNLTPEGLAECVRSTSRQVVGHKNLKLLVVGGGGYHAATTARTFLLCTAAACEAARPDLLEQLPRDVPRHQYFGRYGPDFRLYCDQSGDTMEDDDNRRQQRNHNNIEYQSALDEARKEVDVAILYLQAQEKKQQMATKEFDFYQEEENDVFGKFGTKKCNTKKNGRRRRRK